MMLLRLFCLDYSILVVYDDFASCLTFCLNYSVLVVYDDLAFCSTFCLDYSMYSSSSSI